MSRLAGIMLFVTASVVLASRANCQRPSSLTTPFVGEDSSFEFSYPTGSRVRTAGKIGDCTDSFIPACDRDAIVCVVYPTKAFSGTNLDAAAFQVREIHTNREMMTPDVCVTPFPPVTSAGVSEWPEFMISAEHPAEMIGGVLFVHGGYSDGATSHMLTVDVYRAFHGKRCFELSLSESTTAADVTDPPTKSLTEQQQKDLDQGLAKILHSFRFRE
jgi:hypothetical protein